MENPRFRDCGYTAMQIWKFDAIAERADGGILGDRQHRLYVALEFPAMPKISGNSTTIFNSLLKTLQVIYKSHTIRRPTY